MLFKDGRIYTQCQHNQQVVCGRCILLQAHEALAEVLERTETPGEEQQLNLEGNLGQLMIEALACIEDKKNPIDFHATALIVAIKTGTPECTCLQCRNWDKWKAGEGFEEPTVYFNPNPIPMEIPPPEAKSPHTGEDNVYEMEYATARMEAIMTRIKTAMATLLDGPDGRNSHVARAVALIVDDEVEALRNRAVERTEAIMRHEGGESDEETMVYSTEISNRVNELTERYRRHMSSRFPRDLKDTPSSAFYILTIAPFTVNRALQQTERGDHHERTGQPGAQGLPRRSAGVGGRGAGTEAGAGATQGKRGGQRQPEEKVHEPGMDSHPGQREDSGPPPAGRAELGWRTSPSREFC